MWTKRMLKITIKETPSLCNIFESCFHMDAVFKRNSPLWVTWIRSKILKCITNELECRKLSTKIWR